MSKPGKQWMLIALVLSMSANAQKVDEAAIGESAERHLPSDQPIMQWVQDAERVETEEGDTLEQREVIADELETVKISNLVEPIRFETGVANIPPETVDSLGNILERMRHRMNVRLHLIGHADNQPLSAELAKIYGDNAGLSRERVGKVAEYFQTALTLPPEAISYDWAGDTQPVASNLTAQGRSMNRRVEVEVWYDEVRERVSLEEFLVPHEISRIKVCRMETVCKLRYVEGRGRRARVQNLISPLHFDEEAIDVSPEFVERVREAYENLNDKQNVVVKFVGFTDNMALSGRTERIYGTHVGLAKARSRRVALAVQDSLTLPSSAIESDGRGSVKPLGSNSTSQGRALNRRIEVEFWHDDPLQQLPDEPQLCPEAAGAEMVTRVYDPPWGGVADLDLDDGNIVVPAGYTENLRRAMTDVADMSNVRLRFVGYTRNERLARRTASIYGDDIGLSAARARRAMDSIGEEMNLDTSELEFEGRGYLHSDDVVNAGFIQGETSHVAVQVVYDDLAVLDDYEGVDITRITRELSPENPLALNLMRITVDGKPIDDPRRSSSDIQRCTDVAMQNAEIQFGFDNFKAAPRLSITAEPSRIVVAREIDHRTDVSPIKFRMYSNYSHFIKRAEVRVFEKGQSPESEPLATIEVDADGVAKWQPPAAWFSGPVDELAYLVRAYGEDENFDETHAQPLWYVFDDFERVEELSAIAAAEAEVLPIFGENSLSLQNIGLNSGTVSVRGSGVAEEQQVWVAGRQVPVDDSGSFVTEEILPEGQHTVEVALVDEQGSGELFLRDLEFKSNDWFYVAMADLTLAENRTNGPAELLSGENSDNDYDSNADGRLAFFVNGKFGDNWRLTASADTREGSVRNLFSNMMDKSPESLFRRIDPDYHYPTFGDDGTVEEMAPTMGKFFVRVSEEDNYGQWGNFKVGYMNNELAQVDRGLYGGNVHYQSDSTTDFGDQRFAVDAFAAEPGTVASREVFRGTGGSLYYLNRQDVLAGSERVRIELRDKASGIVTGVINLAPIQDYDVDYLQGRIMLGEPLNSTVDDNLLVRSNAITGDEAYLVVRYEYTPGFGDIDAVSAGGQAHYWFGDYLKVGVTSNVNQLDEGDNSLQAADLTLRLSSDSWLKVQQARSEGLVSMPVTSTDGGFEFNSYDPSSFVNAKADARRADLSIGAGDVFGFGAGRLSLYMQEVGAGYSAPGMTALMDTTNYGGAFSMPIAERFSVGAKVDNVTQEFGLETEAQEINLGYQLGYNWDVTAGYRVDNRIDHSINVPLTQEEGERADAVVQLGYDSKSTWNAYGFMQDTLSTTGNRRSNARTGFGGSYRLSERLQIDAEISNGDLGAGGRVGSNYLYSDRTSMYLNYSLESERTENRLNAMRGQEGNLIAGVKSRLGDSTSVFLEERYQTNNQMMGLTHATGISFAPSEKWNFGINTDIGTLQDRQTGAETKRLASGFSVGFGFDALQLATGIEYRNDDVEQPDFSHNERTTWLFRNNAKYQISPGSRLLGKLNHSQSDSSLGTFYDGGFTEAVLGYAYRPIHNDRLNTLVKYTYFYNVPTTDQVTLQNIAAEFIQKTHIAAVDMTYDLTSSFSLGGKFAHRLGQVSLDRESPEFFDNSANLYVLRGDYRFRQNWEMLVEGRLLDMPDINEQRMGALLTLSRYVGDHLKVGAGYNFTDFSDNLTDLSYDHQGFFLNLTGSM